MTENYTALRLFIDDVPIHIAVVAMLLPCCNNEIFYWDPAKRKRKRKSIGK